MVVLLSQYSGASMKISFNGEDREIDVATATSSSTSVIGRASCAPARHLRISSRSLLQFPRLPALGIPTSCLAINRRRGSESLQAWRQNLDGAGLRKIAYIFWTHCGGSDLKLANLEEGDLSVLNVLRQGAQELGCEIYQ